MTDERPVAGEAQFSSYYGREVIKPPVWKVPDVPLYLYLGGMAGGASMMALGAELTNRPALGRVGRIAAGAGAAAVAGQEGAGAPSARNSEPEAERRLWREFHDLGVSMSHAMGEALRIHGGPVWGIFKVYALFG